MESLRSRRRAAPVNVALLRQKLRRKRCADDDADVEAAFAPGHSHKMCVAHKMCEAFVLVGV